VKRAPFTAVTVRPAGRQGRATPPAQWRFNPHQAPAQPLALETQDHQVVAGRRHQRRFGQGETDPLHRNALCHRAVRAQPGADLPAGQRLQTFGRDQRSHQRLGHGTRDNKLFEQFLVLGPVVSHRAAHLLQHHPAQTMAQGFFVDQAGQCRRVTPGACVTDGAHGFGRPPYQPDAQQHQADQQQGQAIARPWVAQRGRCRRLGGFVGAAHPGITSRRNASMADARAIGVSSIG
jgi:hypothetical protein